MPALFPMGVAPEDFSVGDTVKWFIDQNAVSPYLGKVTHIVPATNKVWVVWPVGGSTQHNPEELIIIPPEQGVSPINTDAGYSSFEKSKSEKFFGTLNPKVIKKLASNIVATKDENLSDALASDQLGDSANKLASKVASSYIDKFVGKIQEDVKLCKNASLNDLQAYNKVYGRYSKVASDTFIKDQVFAVYGNPVEGTTGG